MPPAPSALWRSLGSAPEPTSVGSIPQNAPHRRAQITVESHLGCAPLELLESGRFPCLPLAAILYWLADFLAGNERCALQSDPQAAALAAQWLAKDTAVFFCPSPALTVSSAAGHSAPAARRTRPAPVPAAHSKSGKSVPGCWWLRCKLAPFQSGLHKKTSARFCRALVFFTK